MSRSLSPRLLPASPSFPTLTLRAPSPAAGGARSAAIGAPRLPPLLWSLLPGAPSGRRRAAPRGASRYVRLGSSGSARGREGGGSWGRHRRRRPGPRLPGCAAAETPAGGRRLREVGGRRGGRALAFVRGRGAQSRPRGEAGKEARHRYARGEGGGGGRGPRRGGRRRRASLTSRPGRRTRGEGTRAHAGPRGPGLPGPPGSPALGAARPGSVCPGPAAPVVKGRSRGCELRAGGAPVRRPAGCWRFLRGTLGVTAWTCVCVCALPKSLCTTRACICRLGFVKLHPRRLYVCLSAC